MKNNQQGFTLIEVLLAANIIIIVLTSIVMVVLSLSSTWQGHIEGNKMLRNERFFLEYIARDIRAATLITKDDSYLYLLLHDGTELRYSYKLSEKRLDVSKKNPGQYGFGGRITAGVGIDSLHFDVQDGGLKLSYRINESSERTRFYRSATGMGLNP